MKPGSETFEAEIITSFATERDGARYRAYLVRWQGIEVVAEDPLGETDYSVGDTIRVLAIRTETTKNKVTTKHLSFLVADMNDTR